MIYILEKKDIEELIDVKFKLILKDIRKDISKLLMWKIDIEQTIKFQNDQIEKIKDMMVGAK